MNSKLIKAGLAGTAALAVVAGGTTFAAWSDFTTADVDAQAGYLRINLDDPRDGTKGGADNLRLAPGETKYQYFYLASADAGNTPDGKLTATITNLVDSEDAATCTTNSEAVAESGSETAFGANSCGSVGELSEEVGFQVVKSAPVPDESYCGNTGVNGVNYGKTPDYQLTLEERAGRVIELGTLKPGEGVCLRIEMSLPSDAGNQTQGDQVSWDWRFDLAQVL